LGLQYPLTVTGGKFGTIIYSKSNGWTVGTTIQINSKFVLFGTTVHRNSNSNIWTVWQYNTQ